jgi:hypothetical protein
VRVREESHTGSEIVRTKSPKDARLPGEPGQSIGGALALRHAIVFCLTREPMPSTDHQPDRHPSGTLAIVVIYALLFVGGWIAMYLFVFLARGRVTP